LGGSSEECKFEWLLFYHTKFCGIAKGLKSLSNNGGTCVFLSGGERAGG